MNKKIGWFQQNSMISFYDIILEDLNFHMFRFLLLF